MPEAFDEDFFERVVNVKWETEAKVLWMAGTGHPNIVNGLNGGNPIIRYVYDSENGHNWDKTDYGIHEGGLGKPGIGAIYGGAWMREGLQPGEPPVWVMTGGDGRLQMGSCTVSSKDGVFLHKEVNWDDVHVGTGIGIARNPTPPTPENPKGGPGSVFAASMSTTTLPYTHFDYFISSDGQSWSPDNYHGGIHLQGLSTADAAATEIYGPSGSPVVSITTPEPERIREIMAQALYLPVPAALQAPHPALIQPRSSSPSQQEANIVFVNSGYFAAGKVRKGKLAGKRVFVQIDPYDFRAPSHGGPTLTVYDADKGGVLTKVNCGIQRTICVGYGYYTFCVGGSSGVVVGNNGGQKSTISYSDDLLSWHKIELGLHDQVNCFAVGPFKGALDPTGPTGPSGLTGTSALASRDGPTGLSIP